MTNKNVVLSIISFTENIFFFGFSVGSGLLFPEVDPRIIKMKWIRNTEFYIVL